MALPAESASVRSQLEDIRLPGRCVVSLTPSVVCVTSIMLTGRLTSVCLWSSKATPVYSHGFIPHAVHQRQTDSFLMETWE